MAELSREQVARLLYQAGFRGDAIWKLLAIGGRESGYDTTAHRTSTGRTDDWTTGDRGLFQINAVHDRRLKEAGIINSPGDLRDPLTNARAAFFISSGGTSESALRQLWGADESGWVGGQGDYLFGTDPAAAQAAYNQVRQAGWGSAASGGQGPESMGDVAEGLGNLGLPGYQQYRTDPRRQASTRYQALLAALGGGGQPAPPDPTYYDWQDNPGESSEYLNRMSPHLQAFERWTMKNYGGENLGDLDVREITGGGAMSTHSYGAAFDWAPTSRDEGMKLVDLVTQNPGAYGIQAIHDYEGGRIWHVNRPGYPSGWKPYDFPAGDASDTHFHFEVDPDTWDRVGRKNWRMMNRAKRGVYSQDGVQLTPEQFANKARRMGNRGNPLFEDYATVGPRVLARRQTRYNARTPGLPGGTTGPPSQALGGLLSDLGVNYPGADRITPTPALLAYLAGVGLNMDTAEDLQRVALDRIRINSQDTRQDIRTAANRSTENITTDLIRRGVLQSGEANKRYTRHDQDVGEQFSDLARNTAQLREDTALAYNQSTSGLMQDVYQNLAQTETDQAITRRTNRAQTRGYNRQNRAARNQYTREQQAQEDRNQALIDLINSLYQRPTSNAPRPAPTPAPTPRYGGPW